MKFWKGAGLLLATALLLTAFVGCGYETRDPIDESMLDFEAQFALPEQGDQIAEIQTSRGTFRIKFFPEHAPNACENFITLAKEGYYDNTTVFNVEPELAFLAGSASKDGNEYKSVLNNGKPFDNEYTDALWHFSGAFCSFSTKEQKSDSRFFVIGDAPLTEGLTDQMLNAGYPQVLVDEYERVGGVPGFDMRYTVFAQVFEGMDVINAIIDGELDETNLPVEEVVIEKVTITTYEGK